MSISQGTVDGVEYRANVCGTVTDCGRDVAICFISQSGGTLYLQVGIKLDV